MRLTETELSSIVSDERDLYTPETAEAWKASRNDLSSKKHEATHPSLLEPKFSLQMLRSLFYTMSPERQIQMSLGTTKQCKLHSQGELLDLKILQTTL